ncbi:endonuclease/exonuclease/phosphatase family protein [Solirubrum puertoriconensis]|uniref:endonuclease/exonuclease/phosphatase family protein n=1 Tax=Solirubrum puertoriconensis TaxID=1751427 RepID=UPI0013666C57|nr:endonuclease/exonuclease/phosphatase family protein [Solirubrum puertoriconensis]
MRIQAWLVSVRRSLAFKFTLLVFAWLLIAIGGTQVPPRLFWPAAFIALSLPAALVLNAAMLVYWLMRRWPVALLPLAVLLLTWPHLMRGLALYPFGNDAEAPATLRLLSANVRIFNVYPQLRDPDLHSSKTMISWLAEHPADVLCLQEYYTEPRPSADGVVFNTERKIGKLSGRESFVSTTLTNSIGAKFGMAIFSRFPIVRRGVINFGKLTQNHAMWADLRLPQGDTVRVFNAHLQSMSMDEQDIVDSYSSKAGLKAKGLGLLRRLKRGMVKRSVQVDTLVRRIEASRYPVLLCGDLNDLPYSYTYDQLADHLQNAWATVGLGLGASYNGKLPFLRIDNQFASPQWQVLSCQVRRDIPYSDHFPLEATYQLRPAKSQTAAAE